MAKAKSKRHLKKRRQAPPTKALRRRMGTMPVEFKQREPASVQKSVRVRTPVLKALEEDVEVTNKSAPKGSELTVSSAITQILDKWYEERERKKGVQSA